MALGLLLFYHTGTIVGNNDRSGPEKKFIFSMLEGGPAHSCGAVAVGCCYAVHHTSTFHTWSTVGIILGS